MSEASRFVPRGIAPSAEQRAVLAARDRLVVVEANAGAAKTTTLACRIGEALAAGAHAQTLLVLTYTEPAVRALRLAMDRLGIAAAVRQRVPVFTFDEFAGGCLARDEGPGVIRLRTPEDVKERVLAAIARARSPARPGAATLQGDPGAGAVEGLLAEFLRLKGSMRLAVEAVGRHLTPALADEIGEDHDTLLILRAYEELRWDGRAERPAFRFENDATYDLATRLRDDEVIVPEDALLPSGLALVLVDEMHDLNRAMFTVLDRLLRVNARARFVGVGDRDQVLHRVAGADADFMGDAFDRQVGRACRLPLTTTYRFGAALANAAGRLATKPYRSAGSHGTSVVLVPCRAVPPDVDGDGARTARAEQAAQVVAALALRGAALSGVRESEVAVLFRHPHQSIEIENALLETGVDYAAEGFLPYLRRAEIHFARGLLAHALGLFGTIELASTRREILDALRRFTRSTGEGRDAVLDSIAADPARMPAFVDHQILRSSADPAIAARVDAAIACLRHSAPGDVARGERFVAALDPGRIAARVMVVQRDADRVGIAIRRFVDEARGYDDIDAYLRGLAERERGLSRLHRKQQYLLASIEAVKGLEFEHVLIPDLNAADFDGKGDRDGNRNLFYVAMTRAKRRLTIFYDPERPSRLLGESGLLASG